MESEDTNGVRPAKPQAAGRVPRGPLRRISGDDAIVARELLALAALTIEPDTQTQRQLFASLMPDLVALRNKGCSFAQLTSLLNQIGFRLQSATVRDYYYESLAVKMKDNERCANSE